MIDTNNKYYQMMLNEFDTIKDGDISTFALQLLNRVPEYFFSVPASSSGKYNAQNDLGNGGLVRHSISVKRMLEPLFTLEGYFDLTEREKDLLRVAALFHDCFKSGTQQMYEENQHTKFLHPVYASQFIVMCSVQTGFNYKDADFIAQAVITHMGQWNINSRESCVLPRPETPAQKILHLADYMASRADVNMTFSEDCFDDPGDEPH